MSLYSILLLFAVVLASVFSVLIVARPRAFIRLMWSLALVSLATVLVMLCVRYKVTAYLDAPYQRHGIMLVFLLALTALSTLGLFARRLRGAWRWRHERAALITLVGIGLALWELTPTFPTEEALRGRFTARRAAFDQLVAMIRADDRGVGNANPFSTMTFDGAARLGRLPPQRLAAYRALLRQIGGRPFVFIDHADGEISIFFRTTGHAESMKGYEYEFAAVAPAPLVPSLDTPSPQGATRYKRLDGAWYMFDYNGGGMVP